MHVINSEDGNYSIFYGKDFSGFVQIVEFEGSAPRREVRRTAVPFTLLSVLMNQISFSSSESAKILA